MVLTFTSHGVGRCSCTGCSLVGLESARSTQGSWESSNEKVGVGAERDDIAKVQKRKEIKITLHSKPKK